MELVGCPECGQVAQVESRDFWESTDGPVEHVRVRCVARHLFLMPADRIDSERIARGEPGVAAPVTSAAVDERDVSQAPTAVVDAGRSTCTSSDGLEASMWDGSAARSRPPHP